MPLSINNLSPGDYSDRVRKAFGKIGRAIHRIKRDVELGSATLSSDNYICVATTIKTDPQRQLSGGGDLRWIRCDLRRGVPLDGVAA